MELGMMNPSYGTASMLSLMQDMQGKIELEPLDEWKGVTDLKTRRKLQNRINQRLYRQRQRAIKAQRNISKLCPATESHKEQGATEQDLITLDGLPILGPSVGVTMHIVRRLEATIYAEFATGSPNTQLLLGLTQLNILRALHANGKVLGYDASQMSDDAQSVFSTIGPLPIAHQEAMIPPALRPTRIQCTIPHHPWIDLIPIPRLRDNLILVEQIVDDCKLCHDMCGYNLPCANEIRRETGIIVWRDPWDPEGWEVSETFLHLWGWLLQDCWDLFRSTNRWRKTRGEKALFHLPKTDAWSLNSDI